MGCGNGTNLEILRDLGHELVGVEPDKQAIDVCQAAGFEVYDGTAENLPVEVTRGHFDVVVFMHVLEHCIDPSAAIAGARSVLNPSGLIVAETPNNECLAARRFAETWLWLDVPRHLNFFTEKSLGALISSAGLGVEGAYFRGYCRQFDVKRKEQQSRIAELFATRVRTAYWRYLAETAFAGAPRKYDSVRVVGKLPGSRESEGR